MVCVDPPLAADAEPVSAECCSQATALTPADVGATVLVGRTPLAAVCQRMADSGL